MTDSMDNNVIVVEDLDKDFCDELAALPGGENIKRCFACGTCAAGPRIFTKKNCDGVVRKGLAGARRRLPFGETTCWKLRYIVLCALPDPAVRAVPLSA